MKPFLLVWAEINLSALKNNVRIIRKIIEKPSVEIMAIVKADAYGHGMLPVAKFLAKQGIHFFGVANIDEGATLRKALPGVKILVLGTFHPKQISLYFKHRILPTISCIEDADYLDSFCAHKKRSINAHVKIDTGMGRLGVWHESAPDFFQGLLQFKRLKIDGLYTHFFSADKKEPIFTQLQIHRFNQTAQMASRYGFKPRYLHASNSMGLARFKNAHLNLVRPGIVLYGISPYKGDEIPKGLKPILTFKTRISFIKETGKDRTVSYGATYLTKKKTRIATLPIGYSHGYRLGFSNKALVIIRGRKYPVVGRVTMDQTLIDIGRTPDIKRWDEVTLIGKENGVEVQATDLAEIAETIPYEIACAIHSRIPRIYRDT